jgi:hypothetical protein
MRASRIAYRAEQLIETVFLHQLLLSPRRTTAGLPTALTTAAREQPEKAFTHIGVNLVELA